MNPCIKCAHLGNPLNETIDGTNIFSCDLHNRCSINSKIAGIACCQSCSDFAEKKSLISENNLILKNIQCPGDILAISAAVYSLHMQHPGQFKTHVQGCYADDLYANNPHFTPLKEGRVIKMECPNIHKSHIPNIHFLSIWCDFLGDQLGINLPLSCSTPKLYLSREERQLPRLKNHIILNGGYKEDCPAKFFGHTNFQSIINLLPDKTFIVVGESFHKHKEYEGKNVVNMIGKMDGQCRELIKLISRCDMVVSGVTLVQHIAAALDKPAIVINTREPVWFTQYPRQQTLSANGLLSCNKNQACWASSCNPDKPKGNKCALPMLNEDGDWVGSCTKLILPEEVVSAILKYYQGDLV